MNQVEQAAERVLAAQRALDAHRHSAAQTAERDYQRALEAYFEASERALGRSPEREEATSTLEAQIAMEDDELDPHAEERFHATAAIAAHYAAAKRAVRLVRSYRRELGTSGRREREALEAVSRHRDAVRRLRLQMRRSGEQLALPGLVKTRPAIATPIRIANTR